MLHRLKLRLLYGELLDRDKEARRKKIRVILLSGFGVYLPFLFIAYFISFETRALYLVLIGFLSAITCIPVVWYAYARGFNVPFFILWKERQAELVWLAIKIGFLYAFVLYWMILGIVEFLFGYSVVRAAMISFVAAAVARDGFEIGTLRARRNDACGCKNQTVSIFPDGHPITPFLKSTPTRPIFIIAVSFFISGGIGFILGPYLIRPIDQVLMTGLVGGGLSTLSYVQAVSDRFSFRSVTRFFLWPGFTMAVTYFLILAYLLRMVFEIRLLPSYDLAALMAVSAAWLTLQIRFVAHLKKNVVPA